MKIKDLPLSKERWYKMFKKLLVCIIIIVTILTSLGIFIFKDFGLGYKYYEINNSEQIYVGSTMKENLLISTIDEYLKELNNNGYYIVSSSLNKSFIDTQTIIPKSTVNDEEIKSRIINHLDILILCTKLNIKDDNITYYFKTQQECDGFVNKLNQYIKQETTSEGVVDSYKLITSNEILENKINEVKIEKEKIEKEEAAKKAAEEKAKQKRQVTSRGGTTTRINSNYSGGAPLASYSYISSYYGMRNGKMHTGVDFAAAGGTHIYAWKSGTVTFTGWSGGYGNFIIIQHNDGTVSRYAHCSGYAISAGQTVSKGQTIGYVGTTGNSTGNHLHFEIQINGSFVNPLNYL